MELSLDSLDITALTKAQLADALFDQLGLNKREAKDFIDAFFEIVSAELAKGESVKISGFGNFEVHTKTARPGRNPQTVGKCPKAGPDGPKEGEIGEEFIASFTI